MTPWNPNVSRFFYLELNFQICCSLLYKLYFLSLKPITKKESTKNLPVLRQVGLNELQCFLIILQSQEEQGSFLVEVMHHQQGHHQRLGKPYKLQHFQV